MPNRIVVENVDDSVVWRFDAFCKAQGLTRKDLLVRYMKRVAEVHTSFKDGQLTVSVPAYLPLEGQDTLLFIGEPLTENHNDAFVLNPSVQD